MTNLYFHNESGQKVSITIDKLKVYASLGIIKIDTIIENEKGQTISAGALATRIEGLKFREEAQSSTVNEKAGLQLFLDELTEAIGVAPEIIDKLNAPLKDKRVLRKYILEGVVLTVEACRNNISGDSPNLWLHTSLQVNTNTYGFTMLVKSGYGGRYEMTGREAIQKWQQMAVERRKEVEARQRSIKVQERIPAVDYSKKFSFVGGIMQWILASVVIVSIAAIGLFVIVVFLRFVFGAMGSGSPEVMGFLIALIFCIWVLISTWDEK
jgi:hypothetical protein